MTSLRKRPPSSVTVAIPELRIQIRRTSAVIAVAAFVALPNDAAALSDLVLNVDCVSQTIAQALKRPTLFDRRLVIVVQGTCTENVTIERDDIVLRAHSLGGGIVAADPEKSAVSVNGAKRVALDDLSIVGGHHGVNATGGASVSIRGGAVQGAALNGIYVGEGASASVDGSTIENHGQYGVLADGASVTLTSSTVRANQFSGVLVTRGGGMTLGNVNSAGRVCCGNTIASNRLDGVTVADSGSARLYGNTIQGNGSPTSRWGVLAVNESVARILGGNVISGNGGATGGGGVLVRASTIRTGAGDAPFSPTTNEISGNTTGILSELNATLDLRGGLRVTGSAFTGVRLNHGSRLRMENTTISGNGLPPVPVFVVGQPGIFAGGASTVDIIGGGNVVTGNGMFGLVCMGVLSGYNGNNAGISGNLGGGEVSCNPY